MPATVIMPALELAQETGKVLKWLKNPGDRVSKGEPIVEIETDKVTVEVEAPASGVLREVSAQAGDVVPVGRTIALIFAAEERWAAATATAVMPAASAAVTGAVPAPPSAAGPSPGSSAPAIKASPLARRIAEQHGVDLAAVTTSSGRVEKADVLAYVERRKGATGNGAATATRLVAASPKARRLASERGVELGVVHGSGPGGAILAADVPAATIPSAPRLAAATPALGTVWRVMAERMTASWTTVPHFYLVREVDASRLVTWRERASAQTGVRITYTDLLVRLVAAALVQHPRVNVAWTAGAIVPRDEVNVGLAVAIDDGLVVPVLQRADALSLAEIAGRREDLVSRAQAGRLRPADIQGGTFTISNLGMYGVDAFDAIVNPPQAAILAVGRLADRVVAVDGQPAVRPTIVLTLSCDHRALDGARAGQFLSALADLLEEPLGLLS